MENEISLKGMVSISFLKKERFSGTYQGMRYMLCMSEDKVKATVYPGPYCWEATPDDQKESKFFEASQEGLLKVVDWLNRIYGEKFKI
ncbi:MAG: hypothetical protein PHR92_07275 [Lachnospiraceae bacterium]|nr:hypothetical protein [Lachnospiraceae bacterium]